MNNYKKDKVTLYIAIHNKTNLKYFGKTTKYHDEYSLQEKYHGSGKYWTRHLKKHGDDITMKIYGTYYIDDVQEVALQFSLDNNIVESKEWANLKPENGLDGGFTEDMIAQMVKTRKIKDSNGLSCYDRTGLLHSKTLKSINEDDEFSIAQKSSKKASQTMKKKDTMGISIYERSAVKISKSRIENGLSKGKNNCKAKRIAIYDSNDILRFESNGNFNEICHENNLPAASLKKSRLKGIKLYTTELGLKIAKENGNEQYAGWYSKEIL